MNSKLFNMNHKFWQILRRAAWLLTLPINTIMALMIMTLLRKIGFQLGVIEFSTLENLIYKKYIMEEQISCIRIIGQCLVFLKLRLERSIKTQNLKLKRNLFRNSSKSIILKLNRSHLRRKSQKNLKKKRLTKLIVFQSMVKNRWQKLVKDNNLSMVAT